MLVIGLFAFLVYRGLRVVLNARDDFGAYLAAGVTAWIAFQALINIGGITRTIPLTGIPLPFLSYGGSALLSVMAGIGILLSVSRYGRDKTYIERAPLPPKRIFRRRRDAPKPAQAPAPATSPVVAGRRGVVFEPQSVSSAQTRTGSP
jgi:cell division protein FtsW